MIVLPSECMCVFLIFAMVVFENKMANNSWESFTLKEGMFHTVRTNEIPPPNILRLKESMEMEPLEYLTSKNMGKIITSMKYADYYRSSRYNFIHFLNGYHKTSTPMRHPDHRLSADSSRRESGSSTCSATSQQSQSSVCRENGASSSQPSFVQSSSVRQDPGSQSRHSYSLSDADSDIYLQTQISFGLSFRAIQEQRNGSRPSSSQSSTSSGNGHDHRNSYGQPSSRSTNGYESGNSSRQSSTIRSSNGHELENSLNHSSSTIVDNNGSRLSLGQASDLRKRNREDYHQNFVPFVKEENSNSQKRQNLGQRPKARHGIGYQFNQKNNHHHQALTSRYEARLQSVQNNNVQTPIARPSDGLQSRRFNGEVSFVTLRHSGYFHGSILHNGEVQSDSPEDDQKTKDGGLVEEKENTETLESGEWSLI